MLFKNFVKVLKNKVSFLAIVISILAIWALFYYLGDYKLTIWNLWWNFYVTQLVLETLISILFWIFIWASVYKLIYFSTSNKKHSILWWVWWFFWVLVTGCPACSITLASYLWLASIISVFPYYWLELKFLSLFLLLYVVYDILHNLEACKVNR